jgi:aminoglycoside phosphotransferase
MRSQMAVTSSNAGLAKARAKSALAAAGLDPGAPLERVSSVTNEVWLTADVAIRVNRRLSPRLRREAKLAPLLPPEVGYPEIVKYGTGSGFDFLILRRKPGNVLARCWPSMSEAQRRHAVRQLTSMLRALHATRCPPQLPPPDHTPQLLAPTPGTRCVAPLLDALMRARNLAYVDDELAAGLTTYVKGAADLIEPYTTDTFIHGDLTFENVLWDGDQVTAIIDFEWARGAPRDLELDVLLRFCAYPFLHVAPDYEKATLAEDYAAVPFWIHEDYPALFGADHMLDRARLYSISFDVRELLATPPDRPLRELSEHHPLRRLERTISGRSHLDRLAHPDLHM